MFNAKIDREDWDAFKRDLEKLIPELQEKVLKIGAEDAAIVIDEAARRKYPPKPRPQAQAPYWTEKQRRWWWITMKNMALGKGRGIPGWRAAYRVRDGVKRLEISGAYRRSGVGVSSLTYVIKTMPYRATIHYGTNRSYMRYVIDADKQARYHRGNWQPLQDIIEQSMDKATEAFLDSLMIEIKRRVS